MDENAVFTLTAEERAQARTSADRLTGTPPRKVDEPAWVDECRTASTTLPQRLRARLAEFRRDPGPNGALLVRNLPGAAERPTPNEAGSVERDATPGAAVIGMVSMQLGEVIAYRNEKSGALVQNVVPVPGRETQQSNAGSTRLEMHVENAFHPRRPDYVGLLCVRADHERVAGLQVGCIRRAVHELPEDVRAVLAEPRFTTQAPPSFGRPDDAAPAHAVLTGEPTDPDVQVDFHATHGHDADAKNALEVLRDAVETVVETLVLVPGDLAIVDNRVTLHGRTLFTPRYDGNDRWLYRTFVHLDHRRSRPLRDLHGHVLA
ncbi:TauD/TfdA family dioxygenase [Saccharothrix longispora]|uniref:TauD/TfdA family dioxygenase n=1 Tax=Saccharothrix longispora TaxID=33920 RepID=UPI0028FD438E|nr:TauD/TfdA family dioxygenase [Saccharothrix longispora]MBY8849367.1 TauD/TfdA family dioxygenase [Saccharothrix sp. MB29]MDU0289827.1 TauD/TfdA family dioxygenase [Saccharothrix longispora]